MKKILFASLPLLLLSQPASAAVACQGTVNLVALTPEGDVYADIGLPSGGLKLCFSGTSTTVNRGSNGPATISATQCQTLYAGFAQAMAAGKPVRILVERPDCNLTYGSGGLPDPYPYIIYFLNQ